MFLDGIVNHFLSQILEKIKVVQDIDREVLLNVARTSLNTKVDKEIAEILTEVWLFDTTGFVRAATSLAFDFFSL